MTRRKAPPPQRKRQQITDSSGWTHVIKGPPSIINAKTTDVHFEHGIPFETPYTLETYLDRFRTYYAPIWRSSSCSASLARTIEQHILPAENLNVTQCVCLGLGSLTAGSDTSSYELAALISILELLRTNHRIDDVIFQDPVFTPLDRRILQALGYRVVETPAAFSQLGGTTFLFAPHLECFHYATALEMATPAVTVGSDLRVYVDGLLSSLAEGAKKGSCQIFRDFTRKTDSRPLPDFDRTSWCESTCIYWLRLEELPAGESVIEQGVRSMSMTER